MQFRADMIEAILKGRKTRTTRPVTRSVIPQPPEYVGCAPEYLLSACKYHIGRTYAICPGRGKRGVAHIRVTNVQCYADVETIPHRDGHARHEGFPNWHAFMDTWWDLYHNDAKRLLGPVWVIDFERVKEAPYANANATT